MKTAKDYQQEFRLKDDELAQFDVDDFVDKYKD
jgi:hypothetical protein